MTRLSIPSLQDLAVMITKMAAGVALLGMLPTAVLVDEMTDPSLPFSTTEDLDQEEGV